MLTAIVTAVVITVVLGALSLTWRRLVAAATATRRRRAPDHRTILAEPWPLMLPPECSTSDARLVVACAPSRSFGKHPLEPGPAVELCRRGLGFVGDVVYFNVTNGVRLAPPPADGSGIYDHAWVCSNGKLQVSVTLPVTVDPSTGRRVLALRDTLQPLTGIATAVASAEYRRLHGLPARAARMRTDWRIGVSMYSRAADGTMLPSWQDLKFSGISPPRLTPDHPPFCPADGYGAAELQSWPVDRPVPSLLRTFLTSLLAENGYDSFEAAIDDVVAAYAPSR